MQLVIDANIIIAMLIKPGKPIDLFFKEELQIFSPELLLKEISNNKASIINKSYLNEKEIDKALAILKQKLVIIPEQEFVKHREEAEKACPDPKDIVYFALALHLKCPIWSNEKKLKEQSKVRIYATHELLKLLSD